MSQKVQDFKHLLSVQEDFLKEQSQHISHLQIQLTEKTDENELLKSQNEQLNKQFAELKKELLKLQQDEHYQNQKSTIAILQEKILQVSQANEKLQMQIIKNEQLRKQDEEKDQQRLQDIMEEFNKRMEEYQNQTKELEGKLIDAKLNLAQQSEAIDSLKHEVTQQKKQIVEQQQISEQQNPSNNGTPALSPSSEHSRHFTFGTSDKKERVKKFFTNCNISNQEYAKAIENQRNLLLQLQEQNNPAHNMKRKFSDFRHKKIFDQTRTLTEELIAQIPKFDHSKEGKNKSLGNHTDSESSNNDGDSQAGNSDLNQAGQESQHVKFKSSNELNEEHGQSANNISNLSVLTKRNSILKVISYDPITIFQTNNAEDEKTNEEQLKIWKTSVMQHFDRKFSNKLQKYKILIKKCKQHITKTIPSELRPKVWSKLIYNQLNINKQVYSTYLKIKETQGAPSRIQIQIREDIKRTYPTLKQFASNIQLQAKLQNVLELFQIYRPDIGYVQGMAYPFTILLFLFNDEYKAFKYFTNIIVGNEFIKTLYQFQIEKIQAYAETFDELLKSKENKIAKHLANLSIKSEIFLVEWFYTLFCRAFSLNTVAKVWDLFIYEGEIVFFKVALAIFSIIKDDLIGLDFDASLFFIRNSTHNINPEKLIKHIVQNKMTNKEFYEIIERQYETIIQKQTVEQQQQKTLLNQRQKQQQQQHQQPSEQNESQQAHQSQMYVQQHHSQSSDTLQSSRFQVEAQQPITNSTKSSQKQSEECTSQPLVELQPEEQSQQQQQQQQQQQLQQQQLMQQNQKSEVESDKQLQQ